MDERRERIIWSLPEFELPANGHSLVERDASTSGVSDGRLKASQLLLYS